MTAAPDRGEIGSVRSGISGMTDRSDRFGQEMMETDSTQNIQWTEIGPEWWWFFRVDRASRRLKYQSILLLKYQTLV